MKQLTVVSGKGGTGKTTLVASFAHLAPGEVLADCDVDAPNLHLILDPIIEESEEFVGAKLAVIDEEKCLKCGECEEACPFEAIDSLEINSFRCEGCGVCVLVCPVEAVSLRNEVTGSLYLSRTECGPMVHAILEAGAEGSGKLVSRVRDKAREVARREGLSLIMIDGSPGIGCPVIASLAGVDLALVVTEPTLSGLSDLQRIVGVCRHFGVEALVCINKFDINSEITGKIREFCASEGSIRVAGEIPFDLDVARALSQGKSAVDFSAGPASRAIHQVWKEVSGSIKRG
ncbi:MAG: ATP-binding protein [Actinomycetota bacterium]|nr:ATP-binding protein [Actinomycetota bacterium]